MWRKLSTAKGFICSRAWAGLVAPFVGGGRKNVNALKGRG
ncbi:hypothetical protein HMPREF3198_00348 [Winkia neuii]|nr:hypothetical protein HMPREF3198_00348 [Winkia neuii]